MTTQPLITIGITCYNAQDTIDKAIQSAISQKWPNKEIVIVDDCSSDASPQHIARYEQNDRVRFVRHEKNMGPGGARQTLVREAKGAFLAFFDDDDESLPDRIQIQYERITGYEAKTGESLLACYASGERLYPNNYTLPLKAIGRQPDIPHGPAMADRILYFGSRNPQWSYGGTPSCALMARTETFRKVGGFDPDFRRVEDLDFAVRLALAGGHFIGTQDKLFVQHATEAADKSYEKNLEAELQLVKKYQDYLKTQKRLVYAMNWPRLRYYHFKKDYVRFTATFIKLLIHNPFIVCTHILRTGPQRLLHELKMNRKKSAS